MDKRISKTPRILALTTAIALFVLMAGAALAEGEKGSNDTASTQVEDTNKVGLKQIEENYCKRFPFARQSRDADQVNDGRSQSGGSLDVNDPAYKKCKAKCDYFSKEGSKGKKHVHYEQDRESVSGQVASQRDSAVSKGWIKTYGLPISDTMFQVVDRENRQRFLELFFDPERWMWKETALEQLKGVSAANSSGAGAEVSFRAAFDSIKETLINVADDRASVPTSGKDSGRRSHGQAIYIVQQLYKTLFLPMAILLLLPGAVLTQVKGLISGSFLGGCEDSGSPFSGIMRSLIAIFLIPATQLIVSYSIDVGNVLAAEVKNPDRKWIQEKMLFDWTSEQMFTPPIGNDRNAIPTAGHEEASSGGGSSAGGSGQNGGSNGGASGGSASNGSGNAASTGGGGNTGNPVVDTFNSLVTLIFGKPPAAQSSNSSSADSGTGKSAGELEGQVKSEDTLFLSGAMQLGFNSSSNIMGNSLAILAAYQTVFMCYLFLLGPIAAAFFAWPSGVGSLFRQVFSKWLDAVVVLALWRFWWCVILAVMTQRILYVHPNPGSPSEMMVFNCFLALLLYIPFQPFNFQPGPIVASVLEKASTGGGAPGGAGGATAPGANAATPTAGSTPGQAHGAHSAQTTAGAGTTDAKADMMHDGGKVDGGGGGSLSDSGEGTDGQGSASGGGEASTAPAAGGRSVGEQLGAIVPPPPVAPMSGVAGNSVNVAPPPASERTPDVAQTEVARSLQAEFNGSPVSAIASGSPPTVALGSRGGARILTNTTNQRLARAGYQAWRNQGTSPSYLRDGAGCPSEASVPQSSNSSKTPVDV